MKRQKLTKEKFYELLDIDGRGYYDFRKEIKDELKEVLNYLNTNLEQELRPVLISDLQWEKQFLEETNKGMEIILRTKNIIVYKPIALKGGETDGK